MIRDVLAIAPWWFWVFIAPELLASIVWLMRWISKHSTYIFIWYRIGLGALLIALLATNVIQATG